MTASAEVEAQAKVNLRLRVLARETSGFHQLETLFLRTALSDTVRVRRTTSARSLDVSGVADPASLGAPAQNLAWRAAEAWLGAADARGGFAIELEKRIPVGGGLGGGSADAGAVLRVMDALSPTPLGEPALLRIATSLGADVPFLTSTQPYALAWGRGERMLALPAPEVRPLLLLVPSFGVNTANAFGWLAAARDGAAARALDGEMLALAALSDWEAIRAVASNDFEPVVGVRHPVVASLVAWLREAGCGVAMMSGSGSVVFGVCSREAVPVVERARAELRGTFAGVRLVETSTADRVEPVRMLD